LIALIGLPAALISPPLARTEALAGQYQIDQMAVSSAEFDAVSVRRNGGTSAPFHPSKSLDMRRNSDLEVHLDLLEQTAAGQYQPSEPQGDDRRLMFRIALGLGVAYVVFVACWLWATRLRSRPPRH
jgi:hypothetical protein